MFEVKDKGVPCKNIKSTIQKIRSLLPANQSIRTSTHFNQIIHPCPSIQANHPIHTVWKLWKFSLTLFYQIKIRESDDFTKEVTGDLILRNIFFVTENFSYFHTVSQSSKPILALWCVWEDPAKYILCGPVISDKYLSHSVEKWKIISHFNFIISTLCEMFFSLLIQTLKRTITLWTPFNIFQVPDRRWSGQMINPAAVGQ